MIEKLGRALELLNDEDVNGAMKLHGAIQQRTGTRGHCRVQNYLKQGKGMFRGECGGFLEKG